MTEAIPTSPVNTSHSWRGVDMASRDDWVVTFTPEQIDELESAAAQASNNGKTLVQLIR